MDILVAVLLFAVTVLLIILLRRPAGGHPVDPLPSLLAMQQYVESLRADLRENLTSVTASVNQQLGIVMQQLQAQSGNVGNRLDAAARVIGEVQRHLGDLGRATQEIKELGQSVGRLEELLRAPALRGGLGELLLEDLLKQVLPREHYEMQHRFRNGSTVDAIVRTADRIVPIDSKFPLENFRRMMTSAEREEKTSQRQFAGDVRKHIDAIASKYILPDEGTFPFALMYIPAENIYYEVIIKDEFVEGQGLYEYAIERRVIPVSPNSFYAYLQVIALGLRGLRIEESARDVLNAIVHLQGDLGRVRESFDTLGSHLDNARKKYDEADKRLIHVENRLESVSERTLTAGQDPTGSAGEQRDLS